MSNYFNFFTLFICYIKKILLNFCFFVYNYSKNKKFSRRFFIIEKTIEKIIDTKEILNKLINLIEDKKGMNIVTINIEEMTSITKYFIIVTTTSLVHSNSLAGYIIDFFKEYSSSQLFTRNVDLNNPWILIDSTDIIVHLFLEETREFYNLEKLYFKGKLV